MVKKKLTLQDKAELAIKIAIDGVVKNHKKSGRPLATWSKGKIVYVVPRNIGK